ncbi:hypothetical protein ACUXHI_000477 [Staphylococcus haemolyticus]
MREKSFQSYLYFFKIVSALKLVFLTFETQCIFNYFKIAKIYETLNI